MSRLGCVVLVALALCGCASTVSFRSLPVQTPAADNAAAIRHREALRESATQAAAEHAKSADAGEETPPPVTPAEAPPMNTYDPWERVNRFTYRFNAHFDEAVFYPVATGYRHLPSPLRGGVHHFFSNLSEVNSVINYSLQGRFVYGLRSLGRFVVNSTLGIGGLFDPASKMHLANPPTGFGTTLAKWGMHPGPYFVIPLLGPSTLREGAGLLADYGTSYGINLFDLYRGNVSYGLGVANAIDRRANVDFRYYSTGSPFEYDTIRFLYVRKLLIEDTGLHAGPAAKTASPSAPAGQ